MKVGIILLAVVYLSCGPSYRPIPSGVTQADAVKKIDSLMVVYPELKNNLSDLKKLAQNARYNFATISDAAEILARVRYHTLVIMEVARIASETERENSYFRDIAVLAVTKLSESNRIMELAQMAKEAKFDYDFRKLSNAIREMKQEAELKSLDDAVSYGHKMSTKTSWQ